MQILILSDWSISQVWRALIECIFTTDFIKHYLMNFSSGKVYN